MAIYSVLTWASFIANLHKKSHETDITGGEPSHNERVLALREQRNT